MASVLERRSGQLTKTGDAQETPVLSPKLEWTSAALRRRRLPVRIRPGTHRARSSTRRAPLSQGGDQGCKSPRVHGSAARLDGHSRPKRDGAGSNPAGATNSFWSRYVGPSRSFHEPTTDGYRLDLTVIGVQIPGVSSIFWGRSSVGEQVRRRHLVCVHTRTEGRWLSRPGFDAQRLHIFLITGT